MAFRIVMSLLLLSCLIAAPVFAQAPGLNFFNMVVLGDSLGLNLPAINLAAIMASDPLVF